MFNPEVVSMSMETCAPSYVLQEHTHMHTHKSMQRYTENTVAQPKWASLKYSGILWESKQSMKQKNLKIKQHLWGGLPTLGSILCAGGRRRRGKKERRRKRRRK